MDYEKREEMCKSILIDYLESCEYIVHTYQESVFYENVEYIICSLVAFLHGYDDPEHYSALSFEEILVKIFLNEILQDIKESGAYTKLSKNQLDFIKLLERD